MHHTLRMAAVGTALLFLATIGTAACGTDYAFDVDDDDGGGGSGASSSSSLSSNGPSSGTAGICDGFRDVEGTTEVVITITNNSVDQPLFIDWQGHTVDIETAEGLPTSLGGWCCTCQVQMKGVCGCPNAPELVLDFLKIAPGQTWQGSWSGYVYEQRELPDMCTEHSAGGSCVQRRPGGDGNYRFSIVAGRVAEGCFDYHTGEQGACDCVDNGTGWCVIEGDAGELLDPTPLEIVIDYPLQNDVAFTQ